MRLPPSHRHVIVYWLLAVGLVNSVGAFGLIGFGIDLYKPSCAFACQHVLSQSELNCSTYSVDSDSASISFNTSEACFASDEPFLLSLAWCLHEQCEEETLVLDRFWEKDARGAAKGLKYGFAEALKKSGRGPEQVLKLKGALKEPRKVNLTDWSVADQSFDELAQAAKQHSSFGIALVFFMILMPPALSVISFLLSTISKDLERLILSFVIYRPITRTSSTLTRLCGATESLTRGQALLILLTIVINTIFMSLSYRLTSLNVFYDTYAVALQREVSNRAGILAFANVPVILLYASRNSPLIRLARWPLSTFILLHRWVAYICTIQVVIHSIIYFILYFPWITYEFTQAWWNVGVLGTTAFVVILPSSLASVRRKWYEAFVDVHVLLAVIVVVTSYLHIVYLFNRNWGFENWIVLAGLIWAVERAGRGIRIALSGLRTARVEEVDDEYMLMTVEGVKGGGMAWLYFPTAGWRVWENHPFSIMASVVEKNERDTGRSIGHGEPLFDLVASDDESEHGVTDHHDGRSSSEQFEMSSLREKRQPATEREFLSSATSAAPHVTSIPHGDDDAHSEEAQDTNVTKVPGLAFLIRRERGRTNHLFRRLLAVPVLVEGPYPTTISLSRGARTCPHVVCIAGGVGIAPIMPLLHARASEGVRRTALYFSTRSEGLLRTCGLDELMRTGSTMGIEVSIKLDKRWDMEQVIWQEAGPDVARRGARGGSGTGKEDVLVVVCGPPGMLTAVRWAVVDMNRRRRRADGVVRLLYETFD